MTFQFRHDPFMLLRDVGNKDRINSSVNVCLQIVAVVVHPADGAVLADDPVFHIVHVVIAGVDLFRNGGRDAAVILRVHHAPEGIARQLFEILEIVAAVDIKDRLVCIEKLSRLFGFVNEETSGHVSAQLPDHKHRLIIHLENLIRHDLPLFVHTLHQRSRRPGQSLRSDVPRRDSRPVRSA